MKIKDLTPNEYKKYYPKIRKEIIKLSNNEKLNPKAFLIMLKKLDEKEIEVEE